MFVLTGKRHHAPQVPSVTDSLGDMELCAAPSASSRRAQLRCSCASRINAVSAGSSGRGSSDGIIIGVSEIGGSCSSPTRAGSPKEYRRCPGALQKVPSACGSSPVVGGWGDAAVVASIGSQPMVSPGGCAEEGKIQSAADGIGPTFLASFNSLSNLLTNTRNHQFCASRSTALAAFCSISFFFSCCFFLYDCHAARLLALRCSWAVGARKEEVGEGGLGGGIAGGRGGFMAREGAETRGRWRGAVSPGSIGPPSSIFGTFLVGWLASRQHKRMGGRFLVFSSALARRCLFSVQEVAMGPDRGGDGCPFIWLWCEHGGAAAAGANTRTRFKQSGRRVN
jgi:hypothetical protein